MQRIILTSILLMLGLQLLAQNTESIIKVDTIYKDPHWNLSIDGGANLPNDEFNNYVGFSERGWQGTVAVDRYWKSEGLGIGVDATYHRNDVEARPFEFDKISADPGDYVFIFGDQIHEAVNLSAGPTYKRTLGKVGLQAYAKGGATWSDVAKYDLSYSTGSGSILPTNFYQSNQGSRWAPSAKGGIRVGYQLFDNVMIYGAGDYKRSFFSDYKQLSATHAAVPVFTDRTIDEPSLQVWTRVPNQLTTSESHIQSFGATAGVQFRIPGKKTVKKKEVVVIPAPVEEVIEVEDVEEIVKVEKITVKKRMVVFVKDKHTGIPLKWVKVKVAGKNTGESYELHTLENGTIALNNLPPDEYTISGEKNTVQTNTVSINESAFAIEEAVVNVELEHNDPRFTLEGTTINKFDRSPINGVNTVLTDKSDYSEDSNLSEKSGKFTYQLGQNTDYRIVGERDGYFSNVENISTKGLDRTQTLYVDLKLGVEKVELGTTLRLDNIYYSLDECSFQDTSAEDLSRLLRYLRSTPTAKVEIGAHTDSRGTAQYNRTLSQCRAESVVTYLTGNGISIDRLIAKGYGESQPVNKCSDGVPCSEKEYQQNRRTEFKIVK